MLRCEMLIPPEDIQAKVRELAHRISDDYGGRNPLLVTLLKGSFIFLADLVRHLTIPHEIEFIKLSSYRDGLHRSREVEVIDRLHSDIDDRDIIIVDGIIDTGHTLSHLIKTLSKRGARSIKVCTLLDKSCSREVEVPVHYVGFTIPDAFVIGYGLDYKERYRNLAYIATLLSESDSVEDTLEPERSGMVQRGVDAEHPAKATAAEGERTR
ncbi:MAG: hypoxanthine phosphoribosyltransferase [bacterium]|nr:MAG: hypoxanthine phosphoribosyltransferase [bacterium]